MQKSFAAATGAAAKAKIGIAAAALGAGLALKELYDIGAEFDEAFDTIRTGTGKTGKQLERLKNDFKNVVSSVPTDFQSAGQAVAELNKRLGISGKPLRTLSKQFLELSRITDGEVVGDIKTVTRAFGDWEVATADQSKQLDIFFRASQQSGASVSELADQVVKFGAPLRQVGFSLNESIAMFASFEQAGVNTQTMMPGLKMAMKTFFEEDVDPRQGILKAFKGIEDGSVKTSEALKIFGSRAGGDMIEAVKQGRFHLGKFTSQIVKGNDTIRKAGKETMDFSEKAQLLGNKLKVILEPAATAVFNAFGKLADGALRFVSGIQQGTGAGGQFADVMKSIGNVVIPFSTTIGGMSVDLAQFGAQMLTTKAGMVILSAATGALMGRMIGLGAAWAVGKAVAFMSAISSMVGTVRTAIQITTSLRGAITLLSASMVGARAAFISTGIGALAVVAGTAIGALLGMNAATEKNTTSAKDLTEALRAQRDVMREVQDIDLDLAQRKVNLSQANQAVARAQQRVNQLEHNGKRGTLAYKEAVTQLKQAQIEQRRANREVARGEADSTDKRRKLREETRKTTQTARDRIGTIKGEIGEAKRLDVIYHGLATQTGIMSRLMLSLARENKRAADAQRQMKEQQLKTAEASGASQGKISKLKDEIGRLRDRSEGSRQRIKGLKDEINKLPGNKKTRIEVQIQVAGLADGGINLGGATGSGWSLSEHIDGKVKGRVKGWAKANPMAALGASMGIGGLSGGVPGSVEGFTPLASRFGLTMTSGYRPGDDGYHGINRARDYSDGVATPHELAFAKFMASAFGPALRELIHTPLGFSIKDGHVVPPYAKAEHYNHVHVAMQQGGFMVPGQGSGDKVPISILAEPRERVFVLNRNASDALSSLSSLNGAFPRFKKGGEAWVHGSGRLNADQLATLAHFVGMPNPGLMSQIAQAESSGDPTVTNSIGARGLWQIIPSTADAFGLSYGSLTDPLANARGARKILAEQGLGAWEAFTNGAYASFPKGNVMPMGSVSGGGLTKEERQRRKVHKGRTGKGGGTEGPFGKKHKGEKDPRKIISEPGLSPGTIPPALAGLGGGITGLFSSPGMTRAQKVAAADLALQVAETTSDKGDDQAILQFQESAAARRKKSIQKEIARINKLLTQRMTNVQRKRLMRKRQALFDELGEVQGRITTAREGIHSLGEVEEQKQTEATEALTQAIEEQSRAQDELRKELEMNRKIAESEMAVSAAVAKRALADIINKQLGYTSYRRAQTAGNGSVGSL